MKLVWKYGRLSSISFLKSSIPFWHRPHSIPKFPFHSITCPGCRFYIIIIIVTFYPDGCSQVENPEAPDFEKIASAFGSLSTLSLPSLLPLPTSFIKVLPLPQKSNRFHRFQLPLPHPWFVPTSVDLQYLRSKIPAMYNLHQTIQGISNLSTLHDRRSLKLIASDKKTIMNSISILYFYFVFNYYKFQVQINL